MSHYPPVPLDSIASHFDGAAVQADGSWAVHCPICEDNTVGITDTGRGAARIYCPNCTEGDILNKVGLTPGDLIVLDGPVLTPTQPPVGVGVVAETYQDDPLPLSPIRPDSSEFPPTPLDHYIDALVERTQAPRVLCAQSVLAAVTLAVQPLADIEIPGVGGGSARRPISNFFLTIARSGERKSSADRIALEGVERRRKELDKTYTKEMEQYSSDRRRYDGVGARGGEQGAAPIEPAQPTLLVKEPTQEGIFRSLMSGQLSQGLFNDEAGAFLGGYGMSKDNRMRTCATLNTLWDGATLDRVRAKEHETLRGRRFCLHLMMQPQASEKLVGDPMLRDLGFTARCLAAEPESTIGERPFTEASAEAIRTCDDLAMWLERYLSKPTTTDEHGLMPRVLPLSSDARLFWIEFYNIVEGALSTRYRSIQGFASKAPEHALRLAAVLTLFADTSAIEISLDQMITGIELAQYYLGQQLRLEVGRPTEQDECAELLLEWMRGKGETVTSVSDICRSGPSRLRKRDAALDAVETCMEAGWLRDSGKGMVGEVNRKQTYTLVEPSGGIEA